MPDVQTIVDHAGPTAEHPHTRIYYSRALLTTSPDEIVAKNSQPTADVAAQLLNIPGVQIVQTSAYSVLIQKAALYTFDEMHAAITDVLLGYNITSIQPASDKEQ